MADCVDEFMKNFRGTEEKIKEINKEIETIKVYLKSLDEEEMLYSEKSKTLEQKIEEYKKIKLQKETEKYVRDLSRNATQEAKKEFMGELMKKAGRCEIDLANIYKKIKKDNLKINKFTKRFGFEQNETVMKNIEEGKKKKAEQLLTERNTSQKTSKTQQNLTALPTQLDDDTTEHGKCQKKYTELNSRKEAQNELEDLNKKVALLEIEVEQMEEKRNQLSEEHKVLDSRRSTNKISSLNQPKFKM